MNKELSQWEQNLRDEAINMLMRLPVCSDWVNYKGEDVVIQWNIEATAKAGKPMVDISYCMTKAMNQVILKTVQWSKSNFQPSRFGPKWEHSKNGATTVSEVNLSEMIKNAR